MLARASQRCHTHTQTRQTKWSCECSVAWNHGCFSGQRRLSRVSLPPETPQIFRSFSPSTHWTGQSPCQQDERNASVTAKSKCLPVVCRLSCPTAAVRSPVLVLHRGNELLRVAAPVRLCGRQAESEFYCEDFKNQKTSRQHLFPLSDSSSCAWALNL